MEKLLNLDKKLINCFENLKNEAKPIIKTLQKRIDDKDAFLHDYEIEAKIIPDIYVPDEDGILSEPEDGIECILSEMRYYYYADILTINMKTEEWINRDIHLERDLNWNTDRCLKGKFDKHYISYSIHELHDHTCWSLQDILKINNLDAKLCVEHQNFENIKL